MVEWVSFVCVCIWQSYKRQTLLFFRVFVAAAKKMSLLLYVLEMRWRVLMPLETLLAVLMSSGGT